MFHFHFRVIYTCHGKETMIFPHLKQDFHYTVLYNAILSKVNNTPVHSAQVSGQFTVIQLPSHGVTLAFEQSIVLQIPLDPSPPGQQSVQSGQLL